MSSPESISIIDWCFDRCLINMPCAELALISPLILISLSHTMRPGLESAIDKRLVKRLFEPNLRFFSKPVTVANCVKFQD